MKARKTTEERFWANVDKSAGDSACWMWRPSIGRPWIYGSMSVSGVRVRAHRLSWEMANGALIPSKMYACHRCDVPACVNPSHIFVGSAKDNWLDAINKGRMKPAPDGVPHNRLKTKCIRGHAFDQLNTILKNGKRSCRSCQNMLNAQYDKRRRPLRGYLFGRKKLTQDQDMEISRRAKTETQKSLADEFGVTRATIWRAIKKKELGT